MKWESVCNMNILPSAENPAWFADLVGGGTATLLTDDNRSALRLQDASTGGGTRAGYQRTAGMTAAQMVNATMEVCVRRAGGNSDSSPYADYISIYENVSGGGGYLEMISTGLRWTADGATYALDWTKYHVLQITKRALLFDVWVDKQKVWSGKAGVAGSPGVNGFHFGNNSSSGTIDSYYDWVYTQSRVALMVPGVTTRTVVG